MRVALWRARGDDRASGTVDGSDPWYYLAYDMDWRQVAVYRGADTSPKELFVHHMAGPNGAGGASAIDAVILRERDANSGWTSAADDVLEERLYFCQVPGTRGDVVALLSSSGQQRGQMRYAAYGVPFGLPPGDLDADGDCDFTDLNTIAGWISTSTYDVRADLDLDGDVDATDQSVLSSLSYGTTLGRGKLAPGPASSSGGAGVRRGYAGYEHDSVLPTIAHVRNRALLTDLGRWTRRDPLGYIDGMSLYAYVQNSPGWKVDHFGLAPTLPRCLEWPGRPGEYIPCGQGSSGNGGGIAGFGASAGTVPIPPSGLPPHPDTLPPGWTMADCNAMPQNSCEQRYCREWVLARDYYTMEYMDLADQLFDAHLTLIQNRQAVEISYQQCRDNAKLTRDACIAGVLTSGSFFGPAGLPAVAGGTAGCYIIYERLLAQCERNKTQWLNYYNGLYGAEYERIRREAWELWYFVQYQLWLAWVDYRQCSLKQ